MRYSPSGGSSNDDILIIFCVAMSVFNLILEALILKFKKC